MSYGSVPWPKVFADDELKRLMIDVVALVHAAGLRVSREVAKLAAQRGA